MFVGLALTTSVAGALVGAPDVTVSLSRGRAGPLEPGTSLTWILVGSNDGAAIAHDVVVSSSLPQGVTSVSPPPSCLVGSTLRCPVGDLAPGGHVRIALALHVEDGTCGELRTSATISASDEPPVARGDDTTAAAASVGCLAATPDLVLDATSDAEGPVRKGDEVRYSLTVANAGAAAAHHVTVTDRLPSGVEPINLLPKMDGGACSAVGSTQEGSTFTIVCVRAALDAGSSAMVTIDIRVDADRPCGPIHNRATVSASDESVAARANDSASHVDRVLCEPSIEVRGGGPRFARVADDVRSIFTVTNDGEVPLHDLAFRGIGCVVSDRRHPGLLRPGHHWPVTCARTIGARGPDRVASVAHVTARTPSDRLIRDAAAARLRVIHPDLSMVVEASARSGGPGDTLTFAFVVTNTGDSVIHGISVDHGRRGLVGHIDALGPGHVVRLSSSETLSGAPTTITETATASGSDLSGSQVSARATTSVTVLATRGGSGRGGGTAFTGSEVGGAAVAALALLSIGGVALWVGFRERKHPVGR